MYILGFFVLIRDIYFTEKCCLSGLVCRLSTREHTGKSHLEVTVSRLFLIGPKVNNWQFHGTWIGKSYGMGS